MGIKTIFETAFPFYHIIAYLFGKVNMEIVRFCLQVAQFLSENPAFCGNFANFARMMRNAAEAPSLLPILLHSLL